MFCHCIGCTYESKSIWDRKSKSNSMSLCRLCRKWLGNVFTNLFVTCSGNKSDLSMRDSNPCSKDRRCLMSLNYPTKGFQTCTFYSKAISPSSKVASLNDASTSGARHWIEMSLPWSVPARTGLESTVTELAKLIFFKQKRGSLAWQLMQ